MKKVVSFAVLTAILVSALTASAQIVAPAVQSDYDKYVRLFQTGREPNFATDVSWRGMYARNNWKSHAEGTEFREPIPEAQVLTGLYLLATVDRKLNAQIESMALEQGLLNATIAESYVLDRIVEEMEKDLEIKTDSELVGDYRGIRFDRIKLERLLRQRMTGSVPSKVKSESIAIRNLFLPDKVEGWVGKYRVMREQISVLDTLAGSFAFNWNKERKEAELNRLMEDEGVQKMAEERAKLEIETRPKNLIVEEIQEIKERKLQEAAREELDKIIAKHTAHKYIIGVYQGMDYHVRDLKQIYHYYLNAANHGNPIAQYHVALFLYVFGDIVDMEKEEAQEKCQDWLAKAYHSDVARNRVVELNAQLSRENDKEKIEKRSEDTERKIERLLRLEHDRIEMVDSALIRAAKRVERINELQRKNIEEMERERERWAITQREFIRAMAMAEAARWERMRPIMQPSLEDEGKVKRTKTGN